MEKIYEKIKTYVELILIMVMPLSGLGTAAILLYGVGHFMRTDNEWMWLVPVFFAGGVYVLYKDNYFAHK